MTKEEIRQAAQKEFAYQFEIGSKAPLEVREGFIEGAEWMQERMIEKAVKWIKSQIYTENIFEYDNDEQPVKYICASCCDSVDEFIEKFKQAMEEEV